MFRNIDDTGSRYRLGQELGSGSFGTVCKAQRVSDGKLMACKIVSISPDNVDRTFRELEVWIDAGDRASHVAKVYDAEYSKRRNMAYIYMELLEGDTHDFADELAGRRAIIHPLLLSVIAYQTALGLKQIHEKKIQHRDLKPDNILMTRKLTAGMNRALWDLDNGERPNEHDLAAVWKIVREPRLAVLADFGLARDHKAPNGRAGMVTKVGLPGGFNPAYNAPEMVKNNVQSRYADVFSLGMVIYNLATLHFPRDASQRGDMPSRYPTSLQKLYLHCTEENPKRRPMAESVVEVLDGIMGAEYQRMASRYKAWSSSLKPAAAATSSKPVAAPSRTGGASRMPATQGGGRGGGGGFTAEQQRLLDFEHKQMALERARDEARRAGGRGGGGGTAGITQGMSRMRVTDARTGGGGSSRDYYGDGHYRR